MKYEFTETPLLAADKSASYSNNKRTGWSLQDNAQVNENEGLRNIGMGRENDDIMTNNSDCVD